MTDYAKGGDIRQGDYAKGGAARTTVSRFLKTPDEFRTDKSNATDEDWGKKGSKDPLTSRTGDKCLTPVKPRK